MFIIYQHSVQNRPEMNYGLVYKLQISDSFRLPYLFTTYIYKNRHFFFLILGGMFLANADRSQIKDSGS